MDSASDLASDLTTLLRGAADVISSSELEAKLAQSGRSRQPLRVKLGLDPTAPDIHLGFAVVLHKLRSFQDLGHEAHLIIGDFTAQIGDPSGKSKTRPQLTREQVKENARTYRQQLFRILDPERTTVHFNGDWLGKMTFADVIRLAGKYTVAQTLEREDFARRLEERKPVGLHEILYPLCQGYDSVEIRADVELGGTDQKFNNLVGRELQRQSGMEPQVVLLMPILVGLDGVQKMSKSLGNYVGIGEAPAEMFGKLMSLPDAAMPQYFQLCTAVPLEEARSVLSGHPMEAKKRLGREIVSAYHGADAAIEAQAEFAKVFSQGETPENVPEILLPYAPLPLTELLKKAFGVSGGEARRLVAGGAVSIGAVRFSDPNALVAPEEGMLVKAGKRRWAKVAVRE